jgi:rRNA maturation endonuclease Nob1
VERCTDCGRLIDAWPDDDDDQPCPACGGPLEPLRVPLRRSLAPTSLEDLSDRLLGIGA